MADKVQKQKEADANDTKKPDVSMTRMWIPCILVVVAALTGMGGATSLRVQYLNYRIGIDDYNYTAPPPGAASTNSSSGPPGNDEISLQIQATVSYIVIFLALATDIPAIVTCLLVGSYSDFLGRKPLLTAAVFGTFCRAGSIAIVTVFNINVEYLYIGSFIEGLTGTVFTITLATTATIADLTPVLSQRATRFAIMQAAILIASALAQLVVGFLIDSFGYAISACVLTGICFFALLVAICAVPETLPRDQRKHIDWNPLSHLKKSVSFFFSKAHGKKRGMYITGVFAYLIMTVINSGKIAVEILYMLAPPISWNSVEIGVYLSAVLISWSLVAILFLRVLSARLPLELIGIMAATSLTASLVLEGLAQNSLVMYISAIAGLVCASAFVVPRALLSRITSPIEQGALLSSLAFTDAAADMFSASFSAFIYEQTLDIFNGAVFIVLAGMSFMILSLYGIFWVLRRRHLPGDVMEFRIPPQGGYPQGGPPKGFPPQGGPPQGVPPKGVPERSSVKLPAKSEDIELNNVNTRL